MVDPTTTFRLSRRKGARMPVGGVSVARPSRWGNPFRVGDVLHTYPADRVSPAIAIVGQADAVKAFSDWLAGRLCVPGMVPRRRFILDHVHELAGRPLGCWCEIGTPCHRDVLARMADEAVTS